MRFVMINLFLICLFLFSIGYLAFGHNETKATSESHTRYVGDASWDAELETFYKLLKTDPEAARVELQSVAKVLFIVKPENTCTLLKTQNPHCWRGFLTSPHYRV